MYHRMHIVFAASAATLTTSAVRCMMQRAQRDSHNHSMGNATVGPYWNPDSGVPFRTWMRELAAWLNIHAGRMTPSAQAAAIQ
eukprot:5030962-Karenia_brevis.AAC.1